MAVVARLAPNRRYCSTANSADTTEPAGSVIDIADRL